jgi:hypothetical protein
VKLLLNNISQPSIYLYAQGGVEKGEYHDLVSLQFLDEITWPKINNGTLILWQRPNVINQELETRDLTDEMEEIDNIERPVRQYQSIDEFMADLPSEDRISVFGLPAEQFYRIPNYQNDQSNRSIDHYFRGQHTLYFYKGDEPFKFSFKKIDLNRQIDQHVLYFKIYSGSELVYIQSVAAGKVLDSDKVSQAQEVNINLTALKTGYYRLVFDTNEDVIFGDIKTNMKYLFFSGRLFLADGPDYLADTILKESVLLTDSSSLVFETPHDSGANQRISIGPSLSHSSKTLSIQNKKQTYNADNLRGQNYVTIPKTDITINGEGFAFPGFQLIDSLIKPVPGDQAKKRLNDLDYIIAAYTPKETFGLFTYKKEYDFKNLMQKDGKIYFNIYSPGLYADKRQMEIKAIEITFEGKSLTLSKIWEKFRLLLNNIFKK